MGLLVSKVASDDEEGLSVPFLHLSLHAGFIKATSCVEPRQCAQKASTLRCLVSFVTGKKQLVAVSTYWMCLKHNHSISQHAMQDAQSCSVHDTRHVPVTIVLPWSMRVGARSG